MQFVIDTSAVVAVVAEEPVKKVLVSITAGAELLAPASLHWEVGNAFSAMLRRGRITLLQSHAAVAAYERIPIRLVEVPLDDALNIAAKHGLYAYDAYFLSCTRMFDCEMLTLDQGLKRAAIEAGVSVRELMI